MTDSTSQILVRQTFLNRLEERPVELIEYANLQDLLEILSNLSEDSKILGRMSGSRDVLVARFEELRTIEAKLTSFRQVSETDLKLVSSFHQRLIGAFGWLEPAPSEADTGQAAQGQAVPRSPVIAARSAAAPDLSPGRHCSGAARSSGGTDRDSASPRPPVRAVWTPAADVKPTAAVPDDAAVPAPAAHGREAHGREAHGREAGGRGANGRAGSRSSDEPCPAEPAVSSHERSGTRNAGAGSALPTPSSVDKALIDRDNPGVLAALRQEIRFLTEQLWTDGELPVPTIWPRVSRSDWYSESFSSLGLHPVSDFYSLCETLSRGTEEAADGFDRQAYLRSHNFTNTLVALGEMFRRTGG